MVSRPDRILDNDFLRSTIYNARLALDLEPWGDPAEEQFEWTLDKDDFDTLEEAKNKEISNLKAKVSDAEKLAKSKVKEVTQKEAELSRLLKQISNLDEKQNRQPKKEKIDGQVKGEQQEMLERLRRRVNNLKAEITLQHEERQNLQKQLGEAQQKMLDQKQLVEDKEDDEEQGAAIEYEKLPQKILIPEFSEAFKRSCASLPARVVAKSLRAASGFAAHDKSVWRQTKPLAILPGCYRIRIGLHYRLLMKWQPSVSLQILDLISRQNLETWIKQFAG